MKFAKELEQDLVPEWRAKYLDYKLGKKKIKAVAKALKNVNRTPNTPGRQKPTNYFSAGPDDTNNPRRASADGLGYQPSPLRRSTSVHGDSPTSQDDSGSASSGDHPDETTPMAIRGQRSPQTGGSGESSTTWDSGAVTNYGSIVASPPSREPSHASSLELPDPAMSPTDAAYPRHNRAWRHSKLNPHATPHNDPQQPIGDAYQIGGAHPPSKHGPTLIPHRRHLLGPRRAVSSPGNHHLPGKPPIFRRLFSHNAVRSPNSPDVPLEAYKEMDMKQAEFTKYLDKELEKIESFYKMKENEGSDRLAALRQQLHEMRDRRTQEIAEAQRARERQKSEQRRHKFSASNSAAPNGSSQSVNGGTGASKILHPIENAMGMGHHHFGKNSKALEKLNSSPKVLAQSMLGGTLPDSRRDFTRKAVQEDVPYRSAKRKLKLALQEFYRGLELLKSYALLNRTAFRKINKKYDKAVRARPTGRFMSEKVNKAWFVQSEVLDAQIVAVEDLYARYFERGNHKVAVGKLRSKISRPSDFSGSIFRNGLLLAAGAVLGIQGLVYAGNHTSDPSAVVRSNTSYLLQVSFFNRSLWLLTNSVQIYAGYFLALFLFLFFCFDCRIWTRAKINYVFIFEFDTRHNLNWHQLSELPCLFLFLLGLFAWLNFHDASPTSLYIYWPVILIGLSTLIMFCPLPILYHRSRQWWAYSNFRLLLAGIYPVEFRDFFLGDMYCSQTYAMGGIELFFCLYANHWNNPAQCNSTHSRLLGFLSTLPAIWRSLQCLRRYYDTRNAFPHLVNCGKYTFTILFYMTLSLYRIDQTMELRALFIVCGTINAIYCSIWDIAMDWSLANPYAHHPFLRDVLGYKRPWVYYLAMIIDPILRFNWIFYAIFRGELQHSALLSFFIGFTEICRRGIWSLFRVENEHCTNVGRFRASRDVPLPYDIPSPTMRRNVAETLLEQDEHSLPPSPETSHRPRTTGTDVEQTPLSGDLRHRGTAENIAEDPATTPIQRGIARVGTILGAAHVQDFERRRRPGVVGQGSYSGDRDDDDDVPVNSSDEDESVEGDQDQQDVEAAEDIIRRQRTQKGEPVGTRQ